MDKIYYNQSLKPRAQELRRESTRQENKLWYDYLKNHPQQFRRQKQFARYIVDFYCSSAKLVIELDGKQHGEAEAVLHDAARTAYLQSLGLRVVRFTNEEVDRDFSAVCKYIDQCVAAYCASPKPAAANDGNGQTERREPQPSPMGKVARRNAVTDEVPEGPPKLP